MTAVPRLARLSGASLVSSGAIQAIGAAAGVLTARLLGPEGKGLLVIIMLWPGLIAAVGGGLGLEDALVYFTARGPDRSGAILATGALLACLQSAVLLATGWLLLPWLMPAQGQAALADARLYLAWIVLSYLTLTAMSVLQGGLRFTALNVLRLVVVTSMLAGLAVLYAAGALSVHTVVLAYLTANLVSCVAAWSVALRLVGVARPDPGLVRPMLGYALRSQVGHVAAVANERVDLVVLTLLLAPSQLGLYAAGLSLSAAVRLFGSSFSMVALPALAQPTRGTAERERDLGRLMRATVFSSLFAAMAVLLLAPTAFHVLFGPAYSAGIAVAQVLVLSTVMLNGARVLGAGLKAANFPARSSLGEVIGAATTILVMLGLIPLLGLMGAAIAALLSYMVSIVYLAWTVHRRLALPLQALTVPTRADVTWLRATGLRFLGRPLPVSA